MVTICYDKFRLREIKINQMALLLMPIKKIAQEEAESIAQ